MAIRGTLFMFCLACRYLDTDMLDVGKKQLIIIDHICLPEKNRQSTGGLSAILTPSAIGWITKQPEGHVNAIREAMKAAYGHMWNDGRGQNERFDALIGAPKWIYFDVPGNACDLSPDNNNNPRIGQGYKLVPHNVDGSIQQLALFVGLVKMHELMRADGF
jgi:hypothetical protein